MTRSAARSIAVALLVAVVAPGCGLRSPNPTPVPVVTIENASGQPVDVFSFSHRSGATIKQVTLADGGTFGSEPAGDRCEDEISYLVVVGGRRVATLDRPGCSGATLIVTPEMLTGPGGGDTAPPP